MNALIVISAFVVITFVPMLLCTIRAWLRFRVSQPYREPRIITKPRTWPTRPREPELPPAPREPLHKEGGYR